MSISPRGGARVLERLPCFKYYNVQGLSQKSCLLFFYKSKNDARKIPCCGNLIFECRNTLIFSPVLSNALTHAAVSQKWSYQYVAGPSLEVHAVVRFSAVQGEKLVEIYRLIRETYGDECPVRFANQMVDLDRFFPPHGKKTNDYTNF